LDKFNGVIGTTGIRETYQEILGRKKYYTFMENYYNQKISSFNDSTPQTSSVATNTGKLQEEFDKEFKKDYFIKPIPPSTTSLKTFDQWLEDSVKQILGRKQNKRNFHGDPPPNPFDLSSTKSWYSNLKNKAVSQIKTINSTPLTFNDYTTNVNNEIKASKEKEIATYQESEYKPKYDKSLLKLTELRSKIEEVTNKIKDLINKKELLLIDLSNYETPTFWNKKVQEKKSTLPSGIELQTLLNEYKTIQTKIKDKQDEINEYISLHIEDSDQSWTTNQAYVDLNNDKELLETNLKSIIQKIEGRNEKQRTKNIVLSDLDIFIKQLKENKVKAVSIFNNPDFRKVFDMLTLMSLDRDTKSFVVNLDKYYNFFVSTKPSAYNGEIVDKVFYFFNNYQRLIKDNKISTIIGIFAMKFNAEIIYSVSEHIKQTKTFLENSGNTTTEEFKKLDSTQRRILEGRSTSWHRFFTDSDTLKSIPKTLTNFLFDTELEKLTKLEKVFKRRILDKIEKTKFEKPVLPKQEIRSIEPPTETSSTETPTETSSTETPEKCDYSVNDLINFEEKTYQVQTILEKSGNCVTKMIVKDTQEDEENLFQNEKKWKYYTAFLIQGKIIRLEILDFKDTTQTNSEIIQNMFNNENSVRELVSTHPTNNPPPPPLQDIGGNHKTRRHLFLSKPSKRKTRRT